MQTKKTKQKENKNFLNNQNYIISKNKKIKIISKFKWFIFLSYLNSVVGYGGNSIIIGVFFVYLFMFLLFGSIEFGLLLLFLFFIQISQKFKDVISGFKKSFKMHDIVLNTHSYFFTNKNNTGKEMFGILLTAFIPFVLPFLLSFFYNFFIVTISFIFSLIFITTKKFRKILYFFKRLRLINTFLFIFFVIFYFIAYIFNKLFGKFKKYKITIIKPNDDFFIGFDFLNKKSAGNEFYKVSIK